MSATEKLRELGLSLPPVAAPAGAYIPARRTGNLVYTAGQVPFVDGALPKTGKVGGDVSIDDAYDLARICVLNALAAIDELVGLDNVTGIVASSTDFGGQPKVINGASDLLGEVFGEAGAHARSAVGVAELPLNSPVEVELIVEVG